jgi:hypothetical protein
MFYLEDSADFIPGEGKILGEKGGGGKTYYFPKKLQKYYFLTIAHKLT